MDKEVLIGRLPVKQHPSFRVGDHVTVHVRLREGDKERVQPFRGVVLYRSPKSGKGISATFTVRKMSSGIGVERVFPLHSPMIQSIEVHSSSKVRRSRLFYLRALKGKKARLIKVDNEVDREDAKLADQRLSENQSKIPHDKAWSRGETR